MNFGSGKWIAESKDSQSSHRLPLWGNIMLDNEEKEREPVRSRTRSRARLVVPKGARPEAVAFGLKKSQTKPAPRCRKGAECADADCTFFHGPKICEFAAGLKKDERKRLPGGKPNPQFGKPMPCGKGASCPFDHRSASLRSRTEKAVEERARKEMAPKLHGEADLFAAYPKLDWIAGYSYKIDKLDPLDKECLFISLDKSGWTYEEHGDFLDITPSTRKSRLVSRITRSRSRSRNSKGTRKNKGNTKGPILL